MKKIISLLLVVCMLTACCTVFAANEAEALRAADALYLIGLFKGTDKGYELEKPLTREQGVAMLIRAIGGEATAAESADKCVFDDVYDWAKGYVGLAYADGITKGISETKFGYGQPLTDMMFITMLLRALGYEEGEGKDFVWDKPYELAKKVGLIDYDAEDKEFLRGDMVIIMYRLLNCQLNNKVDTIASELIADDHINGEAYENAIKIFEGSAKLSDFIPQQGGEDQPQGGETEQPTLPPTAIPNLPSGIGGNPGAGVGGVGGGGVGGGTSSSATSTHETPEVAPSIVGA
ncbi:MAG: S-layer homology domain-containing protein [Oscillospiraceae bacterium]|nr:S-layer homology domain-containing protein [Oscillospiraceae bacterium]